MNKAKKQHYVAQFLLRKFATGKKNKAKLWVLDKKSGDVYLCAVRDVGHENYFYEYHGEGGDFEFEGLMQRLDSKGAEIIDRITGNAKLPQKNESKIWLAYYLAAQILRTPMIRNEMENFRQTIIQKWGANIYVSTEDTKTIGEYGPEDAKASSLRLIKDVPAFAKILQEKTWSLCEAPVSMSYIVSDNPAVRHNMIDRGPRGNLGLRNEGIEVYMPLSPKLALHVICPKLATAVLMTPEVGPAYSSALINGNPIVLAPENVEFVNSLQVIWAERFVYAKKREDLDLPLDMLRTNPELMVGPGVRQRPEEA
ncbi:MAG: DUF4238 domain-containing protein [Dissulfurispiraceae bacterium]